MSVSWVEVDVDKISTLWNVLSRCPLPHFPTNRPAPSDFFVAITRGNLINKTLQVVHSDLSNQKIRSPEQALAFLNCGIEIIEYAHTFAIMEYDVLPFKPPLQFLTPFVICADFSFQRHNLSPCLGSYKYCSPHVKRKTADCLSALIGV
jgi:hypothetical protein